MECAKAFRMWKRVQELLQRENSFRAPDNVIRYARSLYRLFPPRVEEPFLVRMAHLEFDSFRQPLLAGVRVTDASVGRFVFRDQDVMVDLLMDAETQSGRASLTGQVVDRGREGHVFEERPVSLVRESEEIGRTLTNQYGEFHLAFTPGIELLLIVHLEPKSVLVSPLPRFMWDY